MCDPTPGPQSQAKGALAICRMTAFPVRAAQWWSAGLLLRRLGKQRTAGCVNHPTALCSLSQDAPSMQQPREAFHQILFTHRWAPALTIQVPFSLLGLHLPSESGKNEACLTSLVAERTLGDGGWCQVLFHTLPTLAALALLGSPRAHACLRHHTPRVCARAPARRH